MHLVAALALAVTAGQFASSNETEGQLGPGQRPSTSQGRLPMTPAWQLSAVQAAWEVKRLSALTPPTLAGTITLGTLCLGLTATAVPFLVNPMDGGFVVAPVALVLAAGLLVATLVTATVEATLRNEWHFRLESLKAKAGPALDPHGAPEW